MAKKYPYKLYYCYLLLNCLYNEILMQTSNNYNSILFTDYIYNSTNSAATNQTVLNLSGLNYNQTNRVEINSNNCSYLLTNKISTSTNTIVTTANSISISSLITYVKTININNFYLQNSFESKSVYFTSLQVIDLFCNFNNTFALNSPSRVIFTHTSFDCDDYLTNTNVSSNNINIPNQVICLSPSVNQLASVLISFLNNFKYTHYSIIYSDISNLQYLQYYKQLALNLNYKLNLNSFQLDFSTSINDAYLFQKLKSTKSKVVFMLLDCGTEMTFFQAYNNIIPTNLIYLSIYNSPQCLSLLNYNNSNATYRNLFKLIPIDISLSTALRIAKNNLTFLNYTNNILNMNSVDFLNYQNIFNEIENYDAMSSFSDLTQTRIISSVTKNQITFNCTLINYNSNKLCQRLFNFYLFDYNTVINAYQDAFKFTLSNPLISLNDTNTISPATISVTNGFIWPYGTALIEVSSCNNKAYIYEAILYCIAGLTFFILIVAVVAYFIRNRIARKQMTIGPNKTLLLPEDLEFCVAKGSIYQSRLNIGQQKRETKSQVSFRSDTDLSASKMAAKYKGDLVFVKRLKIPNFQVKNKTMKELRAIRDLRQENLNSFIGCYTDPKIPALVFEYANRGSLEDIILKQEIKLDWNFKWSMLNDLCRGMRYLHHSTIKYHGNLKSRNCVVDSRWVLKITDYGLPFIYSSQSYSRTLELPDLLWTAPEHLRECNIRDRVIISVGSQAGDIYSFSIIMQEIIVRGAPFCMLDLTHEEIINKIRKPPPLLRPSVSKQAAPPEYINIMRQCWTEQPEMRPSFDELCQQFKQLNGGKKINIVDMMFKMLEQYSNNLEDSIRDRTLQLEEEKKKTEKLLAEMLPKSVAESLITGQPVPAESFDSVTIYFSDIVGFTTISAYSSPIEVVQLLNDLYTMFDSILNDFDVYKVETIGDAYMVVSGLPERNGNSHAGEIATMALTLLHHCGKFKIQHLPGIPLRLRIGLHSGPCVSGVVGLRMPRYCLFGDTVNTASRMESTSSAYRIHVSEACATILNDIGGYHLDYRGITELKGKGKHKTYWLVGKDGFDKELPIPVESEVNHGFDDELMTLLNKIRQEQAEKADTIESSNTELNEAPAATTTNKEALNESTHSNQSNMFKPSKLNKNDSGISELTNSSVNTVNSYVSSANHLNNHIEDENLMKMSTSKIDQLADINETASTGSGGESRRNSKMSNNISRNGKMSLQRLTDIESLA